MPNSKPTAADLHIDSALTDFAIGYAQDLKKDFISLNAATTVKVPKQSDKYFTWTKGDWFRSEMELRGDGAVSRSAGIGISNTSFYCDVYALSTYITERQRVNADIDVEKAKVQYLVHQSMLRRDIVWQAACFATGLWTSNTEQTGVASGPTTNQFVQFDASGAVPREVLMDQIEVVRASIGRKPNVMITSPAVMDALVRHDDFTDLTKYTVRGGPDYDDIAKAIGLGTEDDRMILVGNAVQNTANEGATVVMSNVFGKHVLLAYISREQSLELPTAVSQFSWSPFDQVTAEGVAVDSWYDKDRKATKYEAEMACDVAITANDAGVFLKDAVG